MSVATKALQFLLLGFSSFLNRGTFQAPPTSGDRKENCKLGKDVVDLWTLAKPETLLFLANWKGLPTEALFPILMTDYAI